MALVYILYSKNIDKYYVGSCLHLETSLSQHNNSYFKSCYTSKTKYWEVYITIGDIEYQEARKIEAHIKKMKSRIYIVNLKKYPEMVEKLLKQYVGSSR